MTDDVTHVAMLSRDVLLLFSQISLIKLVLTVYILRGIVHHTGYVTSCGRRLENRLRLCQSVRLSNANVTADNSAPTKYCTLTILTFSQSRPITGLVYCFHAHAVYCTG